MEACEQRCHVLAETVVVLEAELFVQSQYAEGRTSFIRLGYGFVSLWHELFDSSSGSRPSPEDACQNVLLQMICLLH